MNRTISNQHINQGGGLMARYPKLTSQAYINIDGEDVLWYEIDEDGKVTWYLPENESEILEQKMLDNISRNMSRYIMSHPDSTLWGKTN